MQEDRYSKYIQLSLNLFFTFLGFVVTLILLMFGLRLIFGLLDSMPWFVYMYMLFIVIVPASIFITVYIIYIKRSWMHPSKIIKWISSILMVIALLFWLLFLVMDIIHFFKTSDRGIGAYYGYDMLFLSINVAGIFLIGVMQAFAGEKEKDWMEKRRDKEQETLL